MEIYMALREFKKLFWFWCSHREWRERSESWFIWTCYYGLVYMSTVTQQIDWGFASKFQGQWFGHQYTQVWDLNLYLNDWHLSALLHLGMHASLTLLEADN